VRSARRSLSRPTITSIESTRRSRTRSASIYFRAAVLGRFRRLAAVLAGEVAVIDVEEALVVAHRGAHADAQLLGDAGDARLSW